MKNSKFKSYLGDSVYVDFDGYHIVLTTENGYGPTNQISLEPEILEALNNYWKRLGESLRAERESDDKSGAW